MRGAVHAPAFYMYDESELPLHHASLLHCMHAGEKHSILDNQHATGFWLHMQLRRHCARTRNSDHADLFVVPFWLLASWAIGDCRGTHHLQRVSELLRSLNRTGLFRQQARRHLLPSSTFMTREPPTYGVFTRNASSQQGCFKAWARFAGFGYLPKDAQLERVFSRMIIAHMERLPRRPSQLCNVSVPGFSAARMYPSWPPPWWHGQTLVLPYVVDAKTTELARTSEATIFDYVQWMRRPHTFFFAGNVLRNGAAAYVRTALSKLNQWDDGRVHCSGFVHAARREEWRAESDGYLARLRNASIRSPDTRALQGQYCLPPLPRFDVLSTMAASRFCLCPRGDSPSSSRVFYAIALGCIPIIIADPWKRCGSPAPRTPPAVSRHPHFLRSMAMPFHGLIDYEGFALWLSERAAMNAPGAGVQALLEGLGASLFSESTTRQRWRFPTPGSAVSERLELRLASMRQALRSALWRLESNELIANLTLATAFQLSGAFRGFPAPPARPREG